jgi:DNA-binding transcriptional regulator of glucitol operon
VRKYFTWKSIGLHVLAVIVVLTCFLFGRWQFQSATSKTMSWAYIFGWSVLGIYALFVWWKLIHQKHTPFDKLWAVKARAAAEAAGRPLNEIPGWALDKSLRRAVIDASREPTGAFALSFRKQTKALESHDQKLARAKLMGHKVADSRILDGSLLEGQPEDVLINDGIPDDTDLIIEARVLSVTVHVDEELDAYNRYLFELSQRDPPKRW